MDEVKYFSNQIDLFGNIKNNARTRVLKKLLTAGIILLLLLSAISVILPSSATDNSPSRTGAEGNQPTTGFSEGNDTFQIYNDTGVHKTAFEINENITVNITTDRVNWGAGGPQIRNSYEVLDYYGDPLTPQINGQFTQITSSPPYIYEATFPAPTTPDHYLIYVRLRDSNQQGRDEFETWDVIEVGGGAIPPKLMETYSDAALTTPDWTFGNGETVYIKVHTPNTISPAVSSVELADYFGNSDTENINNLINPLPTLNDQNSTIVYHLYEDVDLSQFDNDRLEGDFWYTLLVDLEDLTQTQMANDWAAQILILPPPMISLTDCNPTAIHAEGPNTTTIYTEFFDADATSINDFKITFKVQGPNNAVITLIDNQTHGSGGLTITAMGGNRYNASYVWNPPDNTPFGAYDLYSRVFDNLYGLDIDDFNNNVAELNLLRSGDAPIIEVGNTTCIPDRINVMTNEMVMFYANFSDPNDPPLVVNDFTVTFRIRDESNTEIIIADNKNSGDPGDVAGSGTVLIANYAQNYYTATVFWNPDPTVPIGKYDLYFSVFNGFGRATDGFGNNNDELELYTTGYAPTLQVGDTSCIPSSIDIVGTKQTMIFCEFTDPDNPAVNTFNVTFRVRPPSNQMSDAITLVDNKAHGGAGEFGNTVTVEKSGTTYIASYYWDPPGDADIGLYDLHFMVRDEYNNTAEDPFALNPDELELISSVTPPVITAGNTKCVPTSVNKVGSGTTKIYCEFTDSTYTDINDFNVTFKVRDPNDVEIILVDDKPHGGSGEDVNQTSTVEITYSGTIFTAWYEWNPPITVDAGQYDLYFAVINKEGGFARDRFVNNLNELTIETSGNAPIINNVGCFPPTITVQGPNATTIFAEFTDADNPLITNFTVTIKVRGPNNIDEILLVDDKPHDVAGELGDKLEVKISGVGYMASIDWDPVDNTPIGKYDLYFEIKDETSAFGTSGFNINVDKLELVAGAVIPHKPTLTPGTPTKDGKVYNFTVTYKDVDDDAPNANGVILVIGENNYKMKPVDPTDTDFTDGKEYYYSIELEDDKVEYSFKVTNTIDNPIETAKVPLSEADDGKDDEEKTDNTALIAVAAIIIIIVVLLLLFMLMRKKPKDTSIRLSEERIEIPEEEKPPVEEGAPEGEPEGEVEAEKPAEPAEAEGEPQPEAEGEAPKEEAEAAEAEKPKEEGEPPTKPDAEPEAKPEPPKDESAPAEPVAKPADKSGGDKPPVAPPAAPAKPAEGSDKPPAAAAPAQKPAPGEKKPADAKDDSWKIVDD